MKQFKIISFAAVIFVICIAVAYHNTSSLGYDKHYLIYYNSEGVDIMDYHIEYQNIKDKINKLKEIIPERFITI